MEDFKELLKSKLDQRCAKCGGGVIERTYVKNRITKGLGPYCDIDCPSKEHLHKVCAMCGFFWSEDVLV